MATQMLSLHFQSLTQVPASPSSLPSSVFSTPPLSTNGTLTKMVQDHNTALSVVAFVMKSWTFSSLIYLAVRNRACFFYNVLFILGNGVILSVLSSIYSTKGSMSFNQNGGG
ncbi:hypothetical protein QL285_080615 [Trifolium repens]|nr:hypothetical protein QL285_080615 [Trifolium repens]